MSLYNRQTLGQFFEPLYAAMGTRHYIAFAVSTVAQFSDNSGWTHWEAVEGIFSYL